MLDMKISQIQSHLVYLKSIKKSLSRYYIIVRIDQDVEMYMVSYPQVADPLNVLYLITHKALTLNALFVSGFCLRLILRL